MLDDNRESHRRSIDAIIHKSLTEPTKNHYKSLIVMAITAFIFLNIVLFIYIYHLHNELSMTKKVVEHIQIEQSRRTCLVYNNCTTKN